MAIRGRSEPPEVSEGKGMEGVHSKNRSGKVLYPGLQNYLMILISWAYIYHF